MKTRSFLPAATRRSAAYCTPTADRAWLRHDTAAHGNGVILEDQLLADAELMAALDGHGHLARTLPIVNTDRSVGARLAGELAARHGNTGFRGQLDLTFEGAAGQSFGAFVLQGMNVRLVGEANDYVGKGINGGCITVVPPAGGHDPGSQVILGNTCLYGATGGELFAPGRAGERFAVRNSGARTVVEGAGDHCCEYMTGGVVVVLGSTGRNLAAGMTGGVAFLLDEDGLAELGESGQVPDFDVSFFFASCHRDSISSMWESARLLPRRPSSLSTPTAPPRRPTIRWTIESPRP
mgnify:CR=1 FL=1